MKYHHYVLKWNLVSKSIDLMNLPWRFDVVVVLVTGTVVEVAIAVVVVEELVMAKKYADVII